MTSYIELFTLLHNLLASLSNMVEWLITTHTFQYVQTQGQCQHISFSPQKSGSIEDFFVTFSTTITCQEITQLAVSSLLLARKLQGHCLNSSFWKRTLNWAPPPVESALSTMLQKIEIPFRNYLPSSYGNTGCGVFKGGIQNLKLFWLKINKSKGNYWILQSKLV